MACCHVTKQAQRAFQVTSEAGDAAVDLLEPVAEENMVCIEYTAVSATVPAMFAPPGFLPGINLSAIFKKKGKADKSSQEGPKTRQVITESSFELWLSPATCKAS